MTSIQDLLPNRLEIYISLSVQNGRPVLILRRIIVDPELIRLIIFFALNQTVVPVRIMFSNKSIEVATLRRLRELGLI